VLTPDSNLTCRNSIYMPSDGRYRTVPSVIEVEGYLQLSERQFPDGRRALSFSGKGIWTVSSFQKEFEQWWKPIVKVLDEKPGSYFKVLDRSGEDFFVYAEHIGLAVGLSTSRRLRRALELVRLAQTAAEVDRRVKAELASILFLADREVRASRAFQLLGRDVGGPLDALGAGVGADVPRAVINEQGLDLLDASAADDLARFVPVVERDVCGARVLTVIARDMWTYLGSRRQFADWFNDQIVRCRLDQDVDFVRDYVFPEFVKNSSTGRPRRDHVFKFSAAQEVGMVGTSERSKKLRLYFIDCERRLAKHEAKADRKVVG
jgi:phage anti-repressor protein